MVWCGKRERGDGSLRPLDNSLYTQTAAQLNLHDGGLDDVVAASLGPATPSTRHASVQQREFTLNVPVVEPRRRFETGAGTAERDLRVWRTLRARWSLDS